MKEYLKNLILLLCGSAAALVGGLVPRGADRNLALILDVALLAGLIVIARGAGRLLVLFAMERRGKKKPDVVNIERDHQVRGKSMRIAWCITLCLLAALWLHPEFFGNPNNLVLIPVVVFLWHLFYLPVWLYCDKHHQMILKKPK
ncbi:MAG: hypothetical protein Q4G07_02150 [Oscillospiraceae bacterium]|nr:hypothetical protein [Oscillospiraceae bacterium]